MARLVLNAATLRRMFDNNLDVYTDGVRIYIAERPRFGDDVCVMTQEEMLQRLGYTEPDFTDEDEVIVEI